MTENIFLQILVIFGFTVLVSYVSALLRFPLIVSFILSGVLIGPNGLQLISHSDLIDNMAEIGLAMLLFTIGLEFSRERIRNVRRYFFQAGLLQILLSILAFGLFFLLLGFARPQALLIAFLLTLSSSALGFRILNEKRATHSLHGNLVAGVLLLQDIAFVPMLMAVSFLARTTHPRAFPAGRFLMNLLLLLAVVLLLKRFGERIFHYLVQFRYRELNLMLTIFIPFAFSILSFRLGFSYALGAFLAGMLLSESDFHLQVISDIVPFKDIFNAFFFIAAGMLFEISAFLGSWRQILALVAVILLLKGTVVILVARTFRFSPRHAAYSALFLISISEFSFVLAKVGWRHGIITQAQFNIFFSTAILTLLVTPLLVEIAGALLLGKGGGAVEARGEVPAGKHTVIAGYGLTGRNMTLALNRVNIPFLVVDLNYKNVRELRREGFPVIFGDISSEEVLEAAHIREATVLVVAISDPHAAKIAISKARRKNSFLQIIARTRFFSESDNFYQIGANEVVGEEFETSIEIFSRTLHHYHVPTNVVENIVRMIRTQNYAILRGKGMVDVRWEKLNALIEAGTVETFLVDDTMHACGKSLKELDLRRRTAATVVALVRNGKSVPSPPADFVIQANDIVVLTAAHQNMERSFHFLDKGEEPTGENGRSGRGD